MATLFMSNDAAAVDPGQLDARLERRREPLLGIDRRDVDVVVQHQRPRVGADQPGVEVRRARSPTISICWGCRRPRAGRPRKRAPAISSPVVSLVSIRTYCCRSLTSGGSAVVRLHPLLGGMAAQGAVEERDQQPGQPRRRARGCRRGRCGPRSRCRRSSQGLNHGCLAMITRSMIIGQCPRSIAENPRENPRLPPPGPGCSWPALLACLRLPRGRDLPLSVRARVSAGRQLDPSPVRAQPGGGRTASPTTPASW